MKARRRLVDNVSDWKAKFLVHGDAAKQNFMTDEVWEGLKEYWSSPKAKAIAAKCSKARLSNPDGHGPHRHTSGQLSYAGRRLKIAKEQGALPSITDVFAATHKRKDGTFVDDRYENIVNDVQKVVEQRQTQSSCGSTSKLPVEEEDRIFEEVAPKTKRGKTIGLGRIPHLSPPSTASASTSSQVPALQQEVLTLRTAMSQMMTVLSFIAPDNPQVASALRSQALSAFNFNNPAPDNGPIDPEIAHIVSPDRDGATSSPPPPPEQQP